MKKCLSLLLLISCATSILQADSNCNCECDFTSHTFFSVRPQYQSASPERVSASRDRMNTREDGRGGDFRIVAFGGRSSAKKDLRRFFYPTCKNKLEVKETDEIQNNTIPPEADIHPQHFRVISQNFANQILGLSGTKSPFFSSTISFCPRQTVYGIGFTYRQNLATLMDKEEEWDYNWWFEVSSPLMRVKNDLNFREEGVEGLEPAVLVDDLLEDFEVFATMKDAFQQKAWKYGKIAMCSSDQTKWGLADIELKLGTQWVNTEKCSLESYFGILIPTGTRPKAKFLFEPIVGHNHHWGVMHGGSGRFEIWQKENEDKKVEFAVDFHGMYLFSAHEKRSFDVKCKPWSRYMEVYEDKEQAEAAEATASGAASAFLATPGINVFTRDMKVKPRFTMNSTSALIYTNQDRGMRCEVGFNAYFRHAECVELCSKWEETVAFKAADGDGNTSRVRTINQRGDEVVTNVSGSGVLAIVDVDQQIALYDENIIKESDLDLKSAAHPCVFTHTLYASFAKDWDDRDYPLFLAAGGSYEFGYNNAALDRWMFWIKGGVSF